jgi:hypothetical protein
MMGRGEILRFQWAERAMAARARAPAIWPIRVSRRVRA